MPVEVRLHLDGNEVRINRAHGASPLKDEDGNDLDAGDVVKSAASDGFKRALMKFGLGTHLYHEKAESVAKDEAPSAPVKAATKAAVDEYDEDDAPPPKRKTPPAKGNDWAAKRDKFTLPIGKHKGTAYADVEASYLQWYSENVERDEKNEKVFDCVTSEIKYRKDNDEWNPETKKKFTAKKPAAKRAIGQDDGEDF